MRRRVIIVIILLSTITYAPWWFSVGLVLLAEWRFDSRYELLLPAMIADLAYGAPFQQFFGFAFPATFLIVLTIVLTRILTNQFFLNS